MGCNCLSELEYVPSPFGLEPQGRNYVIEGPGRLVPSRLPAVEIDEEDVKAFKGDQCKFQL